MTQSQPLKRVQNKQFKEIKLLFKISDLTGSHFARITHSKSNINYLTLFPLAIANLVYEYFTPTLLYSKHDNINITTRLNEFEIKKSCRYQATSTIYLKTAFAKRDTLIMDVSMKLGHVNKIGFAVMNSPPIDISQGSYPSEQQSYVGEWAWANLMSQVGYFIDYTLIVGCKVDKQYKKSKHMTVVFKKNKILFGIPSSSNFKLIGKFNIYERKGTYLYFFIVFAGDDIESSFKVLTLPEQLNFKTQAFTNVFTSL